MKATPVVLLLIVISLFAFSCNKNDSPTQPIVTPPGGNPPADSIGQWSTKAPMPNPVQETAPTVLNGKVYFVGGAGVNGNPVTLVQVYDPASNTWSTAAPAPVALHHNGVATANGKIYLLGGYAVVGGLYVPQTSSYEFDPAANKWTAKAPLPVARAEHVALGYNGKIYLLGGADAASAGGGSARNDIYDPAANSWSQGAPLPTIRLHVSGAVLDSLLYVVGGFAGGQNVAAVEAYSPASDKWTTMPSMPTPRHFPAVGAIGRRLYVAGGESGGDTLQWSRVNEEFTPQSKTWRRVASLLTGRSHVGGAVVNDILYVIGGAGPTGLGSFKTEPVNEVFTLK